MHLHTRPTCGKQIRPEPRADRAARRALLLVALGALAAGAARPDTEGSEDEARALLRDAAERQGAPAQEEPRALHAEMVIRMRDDKGADVQLEAERKFLEPDYIWTRVFDSTTDTETVEAFDGTTAWYAKGDRVEPLMGAEYQANRKKIRQDIDLTRLLLRVFFLANLERELTGLHRLPDETGFGITAYVLEGDATYEGEGEEIPVTLRLWIDQESMDLYGVRLIHQDASREDLQICFWAQEKNGEDVIVPHQIKIFRGESKQPESELYVGKLDFQPGLTEKDFAMPR